MKKLLTLILMGSMLSAGLAFAERGEPTSDRDGIQKPGQFRVPRGLRDNEEVQNLVAGFKDSRDIFKGEFLALRQQIADATEGERTDLRNELRTLLKSNFQAQRDFRKEVRRIARAARDAGE